MVVFGLIVVLVVIGTLVLVSAGATSRLTVLEIAGLWLGVGLVGASALALLVGLDRRRAWAYEATVACCWILVVAAVLRVLIDLTHSTVTIPLEGIAAGLVLSRRPSPLPTMAPEERRVAVAVTVLFLVSEAWPLLTSVGAFGRPLSDPRATPRGFGRPASEMTSSPHSWVCPAGGSGGPSYVGQRARVGVDVVRDAGIAHLDQAGRDDLRQALDDVRRHHVRRDRSQRLEVGQREQDRPAGLSVPGGPQHRAAGGAVGLDE